MSSRSSGAGKPVIPEARPSVFRLALTLWHAGGAFRSFLEFALIGAIVLAFLHGLHIDLSSAWTKMTSSDQAMQPSTPAGPKLPITPHMDEVMFDASYFASAAEPLRTHLVDASSAYAAHDFQRMLADVAYDDANDPRVLLVRGAAMVRSADHDTFMRGLESLTSAANSGEPKALAILGVLRLVGFVGFSQDVSGGRALLERAASMGDISAARVVGMGYISGWMGNIDPERAMSFLRIASDHGDLEASFQLARILEAGLGVAKNQSEAEQLMLKAAEGGYLDAQMMLGVWQLRAYSVGLTASPESALTWLRRASERGQDDATFALGVFYLISKPTTGYSDPKRGAELMRLCAERSLSAACTFAYATALEQGLGVVVDRVKAYAFYQISDSAESTSKSRERLKNLIGLLSRQEIAEADALVAQLREAFAATSPLGTWHRVPSRL